MKAEAGVTSTKCGAEGETLVSAGAKP